MTGEQQKTILVTGGAGLIGSHLIEELVKNPHNRVISLDNYFIGKKENHIAGAHYIEGNTQDIEAHITEIPDIVFHLGEYSRVEQSFADVELVWNLNMQGTFRVLEFCRTHKVKIIYAGSSTKFADDGLGRHQSPYAWMKASNTDLVNNYGTWFGVPYAITYFYNNFGERELGEGPYASVLGRFKSQYLAGGPITVTAPGTQTRNFTYVKDTIRALIDIGEKGHGDEYGIGNTEETSILELAELFDVGVKMLPERQGNRTSSPIDTSRIEREFDWKPTKGVREYVKEFIQKHESKK